MADGRIPYVRFILLSNLFLKYLSFLSPTLTSDSVFYLKTLQSNISVGAFVMLFICVINSNQEILKPQRKFSKCKHFLCSSVLDQLCSVSPVDWLAFNLGYSVFCRSGCSVYHGLRTEHLAAS